MSIPSINFITPTGLSSIDYGFNLNLSKCSPLTTILTAAANPMLFNQLGTKFAINPVLSSVDRTKLQNKNVQVTKEVSFTVVNTFPPAYQPVTLRPSVGQLYPLSGSLPY